jgi:hypothetical protein
MLSMMVRLVMMVWRLLMRKLRTKLWRVALISELCCLRDAFVKSAR